MAHPVDGQAQGAQAGPSSYIVILIRVRAAESGACCPPVGRFVDRHPLVCLGRGRGVKKMPVAMNE